MDLPTLGRPTIATKGFGIESTSIQCDNTGLSKRKYFLLAFCTKNKVYQIYLKKKRGGLKNLLFCAHTSINLLCCLDGQGTTIVSHAGFAGTVGQTGSAAGGAGVQAGSFQLPNGTATLVSALLGHFTLGDRHS
jgi:hypothetical protein